MPKPTLLTGVHPSKLRLSETEQSIERFWIEARHSCHQATETFLLHKPLVTIALVWSACTLATLLAVLIIGYIFLLNNHNPGTHLQWKEIGFLVFVTSMGAVALYHLTGKLANNVRKAVLLADHRELLFEYRCQTMDSYFRSYFPPTSGRNILNDH